MQEELLKERFNILDSSFLDGDLLVKVEPSDLRELLLFLKNTAEFDYNMLYSIVGSDFETFYRLDYVLGSVKACRSMIVRIELSKNCESVVTVSDIYPSADWDEREIFDMLGLTFVGRKTLERLFMPKGWIGHPLRKDYVQDDKRLVWNND